MMALHMPTHIDRRTIYIFGGYAVVFAITALVNVLALPAMVRFVVAVVALAAGAVAVGESVERLSQRLSPAATGVVQSVPVEVPNRILPEPSDACEIEPQVSVILTYWPLSDEVAAAD